jgi:hypothetical protein
MTRDNELIRQIILAIKARKDAGSITLLRSSLRKPSGIL